MKFFTILGIILLDVSLTLALNYQGVEETFRCDKFNVDPNFDPAWTLSVPLWYCPLWNKVDLYQNAEDFFGPEEFSKLTAADMEKTCVYIKPNQTIFSIYGFEGRVLNYDFFPDPIRKGVVHFAMRDANGNMEYHATTYTTLSDNKTYTFSVTLWANGMKGFNLAATIPKLDETTLAKIQRHATDIGFDPKHIVKYNYDNCSPPPSFLLADTSSQIRKNLRDL